MPAPALSTAGFLDELRAAVPLASVEPDVRAAVSRDRSGAPAAGIPDVVVPATSVETVQATLRLASAHRVPVVVRGAGTGLAGGSVSGTGSVLLDLRGFDRILEIDPDDEVAVVEPGVLTGDLDRAAGAYGLRYAPDPASAAISTLGGNIATNAGGLRCVKYGVTREAVLGLDVVLADGTLVSTGRRTVKGVAGLDLTSLFVGSEGTLGVVVGAALRLRPIPEATCTAAAAFPDVETAARACAAVTAARLQPSMLELLDSATLRVVDRAQDAGGQDSGGRDSGGQDSGGRHSGGRGFADLGGTLVIAQADGPGAEQQIDRIVEVLGKEATWAERAEGEAAAARLLAARRLALPAIEARGQALIEDICVPRSRLAEAFAGVARVAAVHGVEIYAFAHAGDGNLHPIIGYPHGLPAAPPEVVAAGDDLFALALSLGGTVTGEHGIGTLKRAWLAREVGPASLAVHRSVKAALDPLGILNPGKAL
jgi:glycolate oxidase